jgi:hypothetical protein
MLLPSEPPPPPVPTETATPLPVESKVEEVPEGRRPLEAVGTALELHLEQTEAVGGGDILAVVPDVLGEGGEKPVDEVQECVGQVPELVLDPPSGAIEPEPPKPSDNTTTAPPSNTMAIPAPDRALTPTSPADPAINSDTPYLSANSNPPSPGDSSG